MTERPPFLAVRPARARGERERRSSVGRAPRGAARRRLLLRGGGERALEREGGRGQGADAPRAARRRALDLLSHPDRGSLLRGPRWGEGGGARAGRRDRVSPRRRARDVE